jgi:hypothetical protein
MSDYINHHSKRRKFTKLYHVEKGNNPIDSKLIEKGNNPIDSKLIENFEVVANSFGKELQLKTISNEKSLDFSIFMCMSGNWAYQLNGGQLSDWTNPFNSDPDSFKKWVFYQKGLSCKDNTGRTFWYDKKWESYSIYKK